MVQRALALTALMATMVGAFFRSPTHPPCVLQKPLSLAQRLELGRFEVSRLRGGDGQQLPIDDDTLGNTLVHEQIDNKDAASVAWTDDVGGPKTADGRTSSIISEKFIVNEARLPPCEQRDG
jgi:hypothetical protein